MKFLKTCLALFLLPTVFFILAETGRILLAVLGHVGTAVSFILGILIYVAVHYRYYDFSRMYVFVHELTHAVAALLCGCRIKDISVGKNSGYVKMDRCNTFIVLAPYFVPGYMLLTVWVYWVGNFFINLTPYRQFFLFAMGFFTSFHFIQTFKTLSEADQPDLKIAGGKFFSITLIVMANLIILAVLLKALFPEAVELAKAGRNILWGTLNVWRIIVNYIMEYAINT